MTSASFTCSEIDSLPSLLPFANASELQQLDQSLSTASPAALATLTSAGKWQPARHLAHLDRAILDSLDEAAAGRLAGLLVSMPPQHGKSELCSKYLPAWFLGRYPDRRVILASYEADFAASWGRKARDLLAQHGARFGVAVSKSSSAANRWDLAGREGGMTTAGVGGPITGRGAHLLIVDDPIKNDEQARSASLRQKHWEWWQSVATTRLRPGALAVVIATRWHRDDLSARILDQAARAGQRWRVVSFPALAVENDVLGRQPGEALWPQMYPAERLTAIRAGRTAYYWQAMYQQNPAAEGSSEWPAEYFGPDIWFDDWPAHPHVKAAALDPSKGADAARGDLSAFVWAALADGVLYVDADQAIRNCALIVDAALEIQRTFQPDAFGVETNQFQQLLADQLIERAARRNVLLPLYELDNRVNKVVRIRRLTPYLHRRALRFKADSPGARLLS